MYEVTSDQELDELVWSFIKESASPLDHLDYLRHTLNRVAQQEPAYQAASRFWANQNAERHFGKAVAALESIANDGNEFAMFHLGRWHRLGYGVPCDSDKGIDWYRRGVMAGSSRCLAKAASLGDHKAKVWIEQNCPEKPDWLKELGDLASKPLPGVEPDQAEGEQ
jgi:TPR repeat protein